jgi:CubicO group peptidase (beta-lactamase class C family)
MNACAPRPVLYALLVLVLIDASATAQSGLPAVASPSDVERLDSIAGAGVREDRSVGLVAAVVKGKDTLLLKAYGKSDVEGDVPMTVDTIIAIGSDTKQFTAAAILQLRDQGKLSLDDEITKWLPDFDTRGNTVTLRHLLGHTSGVTDLVEMPELRAMKLMRNPTVTREDVYKVISHYAFMFPTGTMQLYSNSNFWLLGLVVEKASGSRPGRSARIRRFSPSAGARAMVRRRNCGSTGAVATSSSSGSRSYLKNRRRSRASERQGASQANGARRRSGARESV